MRGLISTQDRMFIHPVFFFGLVLFCLMILPNLILSGVVVKNVVPDNCPGCYYNGKCMCSNQTVMFRRIYDCILLECRGNYADIKKRYCLDPTGNCMPNEEKWRGTIETTCVTFYCDIINDKAQLSIVFDLVCLPDHVVGSKLYFIEPRVALC
ncbi:uncharacterized protein LOC118763690 [Octopus sinensis]|uniref:Uncharacterized protein LOC118763690 n=1 Tax=Octopus sinensis TaxID=2607531 RepID=A0A7E6EWN6_9MOLL|nr:uncharacterized protein LOC118763690 [Octopus sinensis]